MPRSGNTPDVVIMLCAVSIRDSGMVALLFNLLSAGLRKLRRK
jgi:hypothetical protein